MPRKTAYKPRPVTVEPAGDEVRPLNLLPLTRELVKAMEKFFADPVIAADFERWRKEQKERKEATA